eukprot:364288-Chlamydomonas_euryale.AAC.3
MRGAGRVGEQSCAGGAAVVIARQRHDHAASPASELERLAAAGGGAAGLSRLPPSMCPVVVSAAQRNGNPFVTAAVADARMFLRLGSKEGNGLH